MQFVEQFLQETAELLTRIDPESIDGLARGIARVRENQGRLFILGVGGSAGHASHAVNDFRKLCGIESYAPTDNVSELTARTNDEGWETSFEGWLKVSRLSTRDAILVLSVGGGAADSSVSGNIVRAVALANRVGAGVFGIVGRDGGFTGQHGDHVVIIPPLYSDRVTPHTEGLCAVIWHLVVSHPVLKLNATKWESMQRV
jgi:D-sedoheptulose 7-phosphate isomerase